ncbi:SGNH/GDSL hydrolase family protein [Acinetobacter larvae]|uniref:SGNH hydrolase-type esterase domain-containing protein n=1 Tax=Acinetobacter larvae TaxID=1789224 RepID=A0A1B2LZC6_9GAMM|nr:SGNH/GDSL hydrolase family protein [Acinetobacter larvae]AOA58285.1 hypothetical protein BFG52_07885 [Acinetobacter larvae]
MPIPSKEQMTGSNVSESQFKSGMDNIVDYLKDAEQESLILDEESQLKLFKPTVGRHAKTLDSGKVWRWDGARWNDAGLSDLDLAKDIINNPVLVFTTSISVDSDGVVTIPSFYAMKVGAMKLYDSEFIFAPEGYGYAYTLYYNFDTHEITFSQASVRPKSGSETLIGVAYHGRFASEYAVKYKNETNVIPKLSNEVLNARLVPELPLDFLYAFNSPDSPDSAPVVAINDTTLQSLGIRHAQKLDPLGKRGGFAQVSLFDRKIRNSMHYILAILVCDPTGVFDFGTGGGARAYFGKASANNSDYANFKTLDAREFDFNQLSSTVRLYFSEQRNVVLDQAKYPDSYINNSLIGARVGADAPNVMYISGYWISYTADIKGYKSQISLSDTYYPSFERVSDATILSYLYLRSVKNTADVSKINSELRGLEEKKQDKFTSTLQSLYADLHNPLMSVNIKLVGDSITWGTGASNVSASSPRTGRLTDPRNTTDPKSPTWANLLRQYLVTTFTDGQLIEDAPGSAYGESENIIILSKDANLFKFANPNKTVKFTTEYIRTLIKGAAVDSKEYLDIVPPTYPSNYPSEFSFEMNGSGFKIVLAKFATGTPETYFANVYIDGVLHKKIELTADTTAFNYEEVITLPNNGKHLITIKNESSIMSAMRIQNIVVKKSVKVSNDGIIGSTTKSWLERVKLSESIKHNDDYVFVQLGTNNRGYGSANDYSLNSFSTELRKIVDDIDTLSNGNAKVILMCANAVTLNDYPTSENNQHSSMKTINSAIKQIADEKKLSFISNYEATQQLKLDKVDFLKDGLHPNDYGYRVMFENIKRNIVDQK